MNSGISEHSRKVLFHSSNNVLNTVAPHCFTIFLEHATVQFLKKQRAWEDQFPGVLFTLSYSSIVFFFLIISVLLKTGITMIIARSNNGRYSSSSSLQ
jgi:hypothetical protein